MMGVHQTIRFDGAGYLRVIGLAGADQRDVLARIDRIAASIAVR
jgi:hypothetical protein